MNSNRPVSSHAFHHNRSIYTALIAISLLAAFPAIVDCDDLVEHSERLVLASPMPPCCTNEFIAQLSVAQWLEIDAITGKRVHSGFVSTVSVFEPPSSNALGLLAFRPAPKHETLSFDRGTRMSDLVSADTRAAGARIRIHGEGDVLVAFSVPWGEELLAHELDLSRREFTGLRSIRDWLAETINNNDKPILLYSGPTRSSNQVDVDISVSQAFTIAAGGNRISVEDFLIQVLAQSPRPLSIQFMRQETAGIESIFAKFPQKKEFRIADIDSYVMNVHARPADVRTQHAENAR